MYFLGKIEVDNQEPQPQFSFFGRMLLVYKIPK